MAELEPILAVGTPDRRFWLDAANAEVRRLCGWHVAPVITQTLEMDGTGGQFLLLPTNKLLKVTACTNDGVDVLPYVDASEKGMLHLRSGRWSTRFRGVTVTIEHGYESAPDVAGVIAAVAERSGSMIRTQSVGPAAVGYAVAELLQSERDKLAPYRLQWGA